jgi:hypothetical protein
VEEKVIFLQNRCLVECAVCVSNLLYVNDTTFCPVECHSIAHIMSTLTFFKTFNNYQIENFN